LESKQRIDINKYMKTNSDDVQKWVMEAKKHKKKSSGVRRKQSLHDKGIDAWINWKK